jgi:hypothetical protein
VVKYFECNNPRASGTNILVKGYFVIVIASVSQRLPRRRPGKQSFENQEIASAKNASQ